MPEGTIIIRERQVQGMTGVRGMKETREIPETVREKGITEMTPAGLKALIVTGIRAAGMISAAMGLIKMVQDLVTIITALREAARGRKVDLSGPKSRVRVSLRRPWLRMRSAEMRKSAESVRKRIEGLRKTLSMKRTMRL